MPEIKILTVVQARISSTRLPGKVMLPILDKPLLLRMLERVKRAKLTSHLVVATSTDQKDDTIEKLCGENNIDCFRGSLSDLLDRHYKAALKYNADAVAKIPSDCPLIDPNVIDRVFSYYLEHADKFDYVSNLHPATYPDGNDVEIMSFNALKKAWEESSKNFEREHTTPYIWENPEFFRIGNVEWETGKDLSTTERWTIDYEEDYLFIKTVYEELYTLNPAFDLNDILNLLERKPEIRKINGRFAGKYWYENHLDELKNIEEYKNKINN